MMAVPLTATGASSATCVILTALSTPMANVDCGKSVAVGRAGRALGPGAGVTVTAGRVGPSVAATVTPTVRVAAGGTVPPAQPAQSIANSDPHSTFTQQAPRMPAL